MYLVRNVKIKAVIKTNYELDDEYYYQIIRLNIRKFRKLRGLSQQDLADMTDISREYICDVENESRKKHISIALLGRIAHALEIDITKFFVNH